MRLRRQVATILDEVSRVAGCLADAIDPPMPRDAEHLSTAVRAAARRDLQERAERIQARLRHPAYRERPQTLLGDVTAREDASLAEVVPFPRPEESP